MLNLKVFQYVCVNVNTSAFSQQEEKAKKNTEIG